jgi:hypothetical protein
MDGLLYWNAFMRSKLCIVSGAQSPNSETNRFSLAIHTDSFPFFPCDATWHIHGKLEYWPLFYHAFAYLSQILCVSGTD